MAGPLLGGPDAARRYPHVAQALDDPERLPGAMAEARREAARHEGRVVERWTWLAWCLSRASYDAA